MYLRGTPQNMGWLEDDGESGFIPALVGAFESRMECWSRESLLAAGENLEKEEDEEGDSGERGVRDAIRVRRAVRTEGDM